MKSLLLPFNYRQTPYIAKISAADKGDCIEYEVSVNEKSLQLLLKQNNVIKQVNGVLELTVAKTYQEETELLIGISIALSNHLRVSCFVNGQCPLVTHTSTATTSGNFRYDKDHNYSKPKTHDYFSFLRRRNYA